MSLIDTIKGARDEATEASTLRSTDKKDTAAAEVAGSSEGETGTSSGGFSRRSAARAKPVREAAGSVRTSGSTGGSDGKGLTKEEKKAARDKKRSEENISYDATQILHKEQPGYKASQRLWWILMGVGVACTIGSWGIMHYMQSSGNESQTLMATSMVLMVVAYVVIIGAFIFDLVKVRPMRKKAEELADGMTLRRKKKLIEEHEAQEK